MDTNISYIRVIPYYKKDPPSQPDNQKQKSPDVELPNLQFTPPETEDKKDEPLTDAMDAYQKRPQYQYSMTEKDKEACKQKMVDLARNDKFMKENNVNNKEALTYLTGEYYYKHNTPFKINFKLHLNYPLKQLKEDLGITNAEDKTERQMNREKTMRNFTQLSQTEKIKYLINSDNITGNDGSPPLSLTLASFETPYRTVYDSEQSMKYYLNEYPQGAYAPAALIKIAQCRIQQGDYSEARLTFKFALRTAMNQMGFDDIDAAENISWKMLDQYRADPDRINITFNMTKNEIHREKIPDSGHFKDSTSFKTFNSSTNMDLKPIEKETLTSIQYKYNRTTKTMQIDISYGVKY